MEPVYLRVLQYNFNDRCWRGNTLVLGISPQKNPLTVGKFLHR
jgi:hypothetical protein